MADIITGNLTEDHQKLNGKLVSDDPSHVSGNLSPKSRLLSGSLDGHGTRDYNTLINKPYINGIELMGDKSFEDLDLIPLSNADLAQILD